MIESCIVGETRKTVFLSLWANTLHAQMVLKLTPSCLDPKRITDAQDNKGTTRGQGKPQHWLPSALLLFMCLPTDVNSCGQGHCPSGTGPGTVSAQWVSEEGGMTDPQVLFLGSGWMAWIPPTCIAPQAALCQLRDGSRCRCLFQPHHSWWGGAAGLVQHVLTTGSLELRERLERKREDQESVFRKDSWTPTVWLRELHALDRITAF
jgi:hypothetical protein